MFRRLQEGPLQYGQSRTGTALASDRRKVNRVVVDCDAIFESHSRQRSGRLADLSESGARFDGPDLPSVGTSGLLRWHDQEHFAQVIWVENGGCGLQFERVIAASTVARTAEVVEVEVGPVAKFGNIPLGRKRSRIAQLRGAA